MNGIDLSPYDAAVDSGATTIPSYPRSEIPPPPVPRMSLRVVGAGVGVFLLLAWSIVATIDFVYGYWELYAAGEAIKVVLPAVYIGLCLGVVVGFCWCGRVRK